MRSNTSLRAAETRQTYRVNKDKFKECGLLIERENPGRRGDQLIMKNEKLPPLQKGRRPLRGKEALKLKRGREGRLKNLRRGSPMILSFLINR
jgi:hypothetical protein